MNEQKKETFDPVEEKLTPPVAEPIPEEKTEPAEKTEVAFDEQVTDDETSKDDEALKSFLNRDTETAKKPVSPRSRKTLIIVIAALVVVAILVTVMVILLSHPLKTADDSYKEASISLHVNSDGVHEANISLDENGNIRENGAGTLLTYVPAEIKQIDVENSEGSFRVTATTPSGEATVYKLVGFENYPLQDGIADEVANHSAGLKFIRILEVNANLADFGLDQPRATAKVTYTDDTSSVIRIGNAAAGEAGTYVAFGTSNDVYLVSNDDVACFLYSVNRFISLSITDTMEDSANSQFSDVTISGTHFDKSIVLKPNTDEALGASYLLAEPIQVPANAIEAGDIAGNIRGLYAESVVCVNPNSDQLSTYGLSDPYAAVKATYPDTEITLQSSSPNDDGTVYLYNPDKNVVYSIQLAAVCWAKTSVDLLMPENPLNVKLKSVSDISFIAGDTDFSLSVTTKSETVTDDSGNEQENTTSTASYDGKDLDTDNFNVFFQNITGIKNLGSTDDSGKDKILSVTMSYTTDRPDDTLTIYSGGDGAKYIMTFNGVTIGTVSKTYINSLIDGAENLIAGKTVEGL